jgi:hypothetical protein
MLSPTARKHGTRECGQVIVFVALLIPVILTIGSIVVSVGNWYVLKRHLQTQVDAAALAGGPAFTGCTQEPATTNLKIAQQALEYAGDTYRDPTNPASTYNLQLEQGGDQHVVLNSSLYWTGGATDGTGYDDTLDSNDADTDGSPCNERYLDVKATDDKAPLLFRWIPLYPSLKTRARVEISEVESTNGLRPLGVPEVDMETVAVLFVDEDGNPNSTNSIRGSAFLDEDTTPPSGLEGMSIWSKDAISPVGINGNDNFSVVILASKDPKNLVSLGGTLSTICNQNPTQTHCYAGGTLTSGVSFIHAYSSQGNGSAQNPIVRDVSLGGGCTDDLSRPYFNVEGGCPIGINATIDFGTGATDPRRPVALGGVCASVSASPGGNLAWSGGVWTGVFTPAKESGQTEVDLNWDTDNAGGCGGPGGHSGSFNKVAKPYVADDASGPVQYLTVEKSIGGLANSMEKDSAASLDVAVGFTAPLTDAMPGDAPIVLRGWDVSSQSQALDCANGASGWNTAMQNGCLDAYQVYDPAKHVSKCGSPPSGVPAADPEDCISSKNGNFQENDVVDMFDDCSATPNNWYRNGHTVPDGNDPRWMPLFIVDELAFKVSGKRTYPIRRFGMFYVTAVSGLNCSGDDPNPVAAGKRQVWGHFMTYVSGTFGDTIPSNVLCSFQDGGLCVSNLVE